MALCPVKTCRPPNREIMLACCSHAQKAIPSKTNAEIPLKLEVPKRAASLKVRSSRRLKAGTSREREGKCEHKRCDKAKPDSSPVPTIQTANCEMASRTQTRQTCKRAGWLPTRSQTSMQTCRWKAKRHISARTNQAVASTGLPWYTHVRITGPIHTTRMRASIVGLPLVPQHESLANPIRARNTQPTSQHYVSTTFHEV